jgi:hypothetical protein
MKLDFFLPMLSPLQPLYLSSLLSPISSYLFFSNLLLILSLDSISPICIPKYSSIKCWRKNCLLVQEFTKSHGVDL